MKNKKKKVVDTYMSMTFFGYIFLLEKPSGNNIMLKSYNKKQLLLLLFFQHKCIITIIYKQKKGNEKGEKQ